MRFTMQGLPVLLLAAALSACASLGGDPTAGLDNAQVNTRTESNGDVISEYRIAGQLKVVKITPTRGPVYYLMDSNGDGKLDSSKGEGPISPVQYKLFSW